MTAPMVVAWLSATTLSVGFVVWVYRSREVAVVGRTIPAATRACSLALLLILLVDPTIPAGDDGRGPGARWVLLDASSSMSVPADSATPWERALALATGADREGAAVVAFADGLIASRDPATWSASHPATRLGEALQRAVEAGAAEIVVLSDLRFEDPVAVRAVLAREQVAVTFEDVGVEVRNAGVATFEVPERASRDDGFTAQVTLHATELAAGDTATLEIREEGRMVYASDVTLASAGRRQRVEVPLPPPADTGEVRYVATVRLGGDVFEADDRAVAYLDVDPEAGFLVGIALEPTWEARFLLPVLGRVSGLPVRSLLSLADGRWMRTGTDLAPETVDAADVRALVDGAEMLVLLGFTGRTPGWLRDAVEGVPRAVVVPGDASGASTLGLPATRASKGEWYLTASAPPSPLAADLEGAAWQGLPPFTELIPVDAGDLATPLRAQLRGTGPDLPAVVLQEGDGNRRVVVTGRGSWRWAFRSAASREAYRRLWSGAAGWLLADDEVVASPGLAPVERVIASGGSMQWSAPAWSGEALTLHVEAVDVEALDSVAVRVADTALVVAPSGLFETPAPPPGAYRYRAVAGDESRTREGRFDVVAASEDLAPPPARDLVSRATSARAARAPSRTRPLRTHPLPYLFLLTLLCFEWIARRRMGLR